MARKDNVDVIKAFHRLTDAAEDFVNRSPRLKRIQTERSTLLDAIADAQLVLSVHRLPTEPPKAGSGRSAADERKTELERELKHSEHALHELKRRLQPVTRELHGLQRQAEHAVRGLEAALGEPEGTSGDPSREG
ncbi:MAG TPA: hypothetical protein VFL19_03480 [Nitrospira sp.]|nr:hypothetical protein [Nitrospira sp.]